MNNVYGCTVSEQSDIKPETNYDVASALYKVPGWRLYHDERVGAAHEAD